MEVPGSLRVESVSNGWATSPTVGTRYKLGVKAQTIGRQRGVDIFFDDVTVSRRHAEVQRTGDRYLVRDTGSLTGTYVNGEQITAFDEIAELQDGDEIQVGRCLLIFDVSPPSEEPLPHTTERKVPPKLRWKVLARDGFRCVVDGSTQRDDGVKLRVDHIVPYSKGGKTAINNLQTLCNDCSTPSEESPPHTTAKKVPPGLRRKVLERDGFRCLVDGRTPRDDGVELHVDHIVPYSKGGETVVDNLQTLCNDCNHGKGNKDETDFRFALTAIHDEGTTVSAPRERRDLDCLSQENFVSQNCRGDSFATKNLRGANFSGADLKLANFSKAFLVDASLSEADLSRADLSWADLTRAFLTGANLGGANFSGANLSGAYLYGAYLKGVNFSGANLGGAYLTGTKADASTRWPEGFDPVAAGVIFE